MFWDRIAGMYAHVIALVNKDINGEQTFCLSDGVCIMKEAARLLVKGKIERYV